MLPDDNIILSTDHFPSFWYIRFFLGLILAFTASHASADAFNCLWFDNFNLIHHYSSNLTAPNYNVSEVQGFSNTSTNVYDTDTAQMNVTIIGVRDLAENKLILKELDQQLEIVEMVQQQLECCGIEGSYEWLGLYSGEFMHEKMTKFDLWWSNSSLPRRFPHSCCPQTNFLCSVYLSKNKTKRAYYTEEVVGCRKKIVHEVSKGIRIMSSFLNGAIILQLILTPPIYILVEKRRQLERLEYIERWERHIEIAQEQEIKRTDTQNSLSEDK
ncbi:unnamed protein product [Thelazia callipaeda]|uniref:Transmembrane protein n=1 Tax=Thelazia callipaeda TaxID=103827 RepID=A0A0N5CXD4_THECL|nr:unnamed protein product [Thelazia callipaeda]